MKKCIILTIIIAAQFVFMAKAQNKVSGEVKLDYVSFSNYIRPEDSIKTNSKSNFQRAQINLSIPLSVKQTEDGRPKTWSLLVSSAYARMQHKDYETQLFPTQMLNAQVGLQHLRPLGKGKWSLMLVGTIGLYTDLEQVDAHAILGQGAVVFIKRFNPNISFGFGPGVTTAFGVPMIMPFIYFDWKNSGKFKFRINFPEGAEAGYQFTDNFSLKGVVNLDGMTVERKVDGVSKLLGYQQITVGLRPEVKLNNSLSLRLTGGSTVVRTFTENDRNLKSIFKDKKQQDPSFTKSAYVAVALRWNLP